MLNVSISSFPVVLNSFVIHHTAAQSTRRYRILARIFKWNFKDHLRPLQNSNGALVVSRIAFHKIVPFHFGFKKICLSWHGAVPIFNWNATVFHLQGSECNSGGGQCIKHFFKLSYVVFGDSLLRLSLQSPHNFELKYDSLN